MDLGRSDLIRERQDKTRLTAIVDRLGLFEEAAGNHQDSERVRRINVSVVSIDHDFG